MAKTPPTDLQRLREFHNEGAEGLAETHCKRLLQLMEAIQEPAVRPHVLREALQPLSEPLLLVILHRILLKAESGQAAARSLLTTLALTPAILDERPPSEQDRLKQLAEDGGLIAVRRLLLQPAFEKKGLLKAYDDNEHMAMPLGSRRQAARSRNRRKLDRLLHDRDHRVIQILLNNPLVIERDVIAIAARRPTRSEVLQVIASHKKWSTRYRVRKALICNPHTPDSVALRLLPTLLIQDLRFLVNSGALLPELRQEARALITRRSRH
jgi:hypothetical protein